MNDIAAMLTAYPVERRGPDEDALVLCIQECLNCGQTCALCADACLADPTGSEVARCAGAALRCADIVSATARTLAWQIVDDTPVTRAVLQSCVEVCRACYDDCRRHALPHEYCRVCAEACRRCAKACHALLATLTPPEPGRDLAGWLS